MYVEEKDRARIFSMAAMCYVKSGTPARSPKDLAEDSVIYAKELLRLYLKEFSNGR